MISDFLMSVWGPLSSKEKELQAYVQRPKIALAPFVVVQSKLAESSKSFTLIFNHRSNFRIFAEN